MAHYHRSLLALIALPLCIAAGSTLAQDNTQKLDLQFPVNCSLDQDCFIQQFTDMDVSEKSLDPFCGSATYDGHKGTDIRLRTLKDMERNVEVLAAASGTVKGVRKNVPDRLIASDADRAAVKGRECGNGIVIDHGNNIETQYCHLKRNSPTVNRGDKVKAGDTLGFVGASGMAQFPHLHISVRKDGKVIDPFTGNMQSDGCDKTPDHMWWIAPSILNAKHDAILLGSDLAGAPTQHKTMVVEPPLKATTQDDATVGWVWYSNLKANDRVYIKLTGPNGFEAETISKPMNRNKASWSGFAGKKRKPQIGTYKINSYILREDDSGTVVKLSRSVKVIVVDE